jgi:hypothetical protein
MHGYEKVTRAGSSLWKTWMMQVSKFQGFRVSKTKALAISDS